MNPFRSSDFSEYPTAAGFIANVCDWNPPGVTPGSEQDPQQWSSPWSLLIARKEK